MTDAEFDIIDELYFVTSFADLARALGATPESLGPDLAQLVQQGLVKCFYPDPDTEVPFSEDFRNQYQLYFFLATKAGLLAHNSR